MPQPQHPVGAADDPFVVAGDHHGAAVRARPAPAPVITRSALAWSSSAVGSSATTSAGRPTSASATASRCCSPPELVDGTWSAAVREVDGAQRLADVARRRPPRSAATWRSCSAAVRCGNSDPDDRCATKPIRRRRRSRSVAGRRRGQVGAEHVEVAGAGPVAGGDQVQQAALPAARRAGHDGEDARVQQQVEPAQGVRLAGGRPVDLHQPVAGDGGRRRHRRRDPSAVATQHLRGDPVHRRGAGRSAPAAATSTSARRAPARRRRSSRAAAGSAAACAPPARSSRAPGPGGPPPTAATRTSPTANATSQVRAAARSRAPVATSAAAARR